jgi:hypothetical protein
MTSQSITCYKQVNGFYLKCANVAFSLPQKEHAFRSFRQTSYKNETKFLLFFTSHPKNIDSLLKSWVYFILRKIGHTFYFS